MTANNDEELFARGLHDGADDFLAKPITPSLLEAKIQALLRVGEVLQEQRDRNEELNRWRARAEQDFGVAQKLFEHIAERGRFDFPNLDIRALSLEAFNGDIVLAAPLGKGRLRLLVGDFAGHGLGAALGAMPVSDVFYAMTRRRFPIEAVVREIGGKLYRMFPRHQFLAAAVADIDTVAEKALVWNGGLPASVGARRRPGASSGARRRGTWRWACNRRATWSRRSPSCRCRSAAGWCCTPTGSSRRARPSGESFGDERLERLLSEATGDDWFASLWSSFETFQARQPHGDDVTLVGLRHTEALRAALVTRAPSGGLGAESEISIRLGFDHTALREPDPLAPLRILIEASPALVAVAAELYTIACELFANAVDHGVLRLDSKIKAQPGGFDEYYRRRETRLRELASGSITVVFEVLPKPGRRFATIRISDDGPGITEDVLRAVRDPKARSGRGLPLVHRARRRAAHPRRRPHRRGAVPAQRRVRSSQRSAVQAAAHSLRRVVVVDLAIDDRLDRGAATSAAGAGSAGRGDGGRRGRAVANTLTDRPIEHTEAMTNQHRGGVLDTR